MHAIKEPDLDDFTDDEIREEHKERFGEDSLSDWDSDDLIDELETRNAMPEPEQVESDEIDEIADLIAEAARVSPHARRAYALLRDLYPEALPEMAARQRLIEGRMGGLPL